MWEPIDTMAGWDTRVWYTGLVGLVALMRLVELAIARRHERRLLAAGGIEVGAGHYPWMVALHASLLVACLGEVWLLDRPFVPAFAAGGSGLLVAAAALRAWVIATLGERWTTRVVVVPGRPRIESGPYRLTSHPNYVAVIVEIIALPVVHGAWLTAATFGSVNLLMLLAVRVPVEEQALARAAEGTHRDASS